MTLLDRLVLWLAMNALERQLEAISVEKFECKDGTHTDSDCGFELLDRVKYRR